MLCTPVLVRQRGNLIHIAALHLTLFKMVLGKSDLPQLPMVLCHIGYDCKAVTV